MVAASKMRNAQLAVENSRGMVEPFVRLFGDYPGKLVFWCRSGLVPPLCLAEGTQQLHSGAVPPNCIHPWHRRYAVDFSCAHPSESKCQL